jgi:aminobenzoyl-glutamate utilization protein B
MATPIAHKGVLSGAKVQAMTIVDILMRPQLVKEAWEYFTNVQTKDTKYMPFIAPDTPAPIWLNKEVAERYRPEMKTYYYDPTKYNTYLEQLGVTYPRLLRPNSPQ